MYTYSYDRESQILKVDFFDNMSLDDVQNFLDELKTFSFLPGDLKVIFDLSDSDIKINPREVKYISDLAQEKTTDFNSVRSAFLVDTPIQAALSLIFSKTPVKPNTTRRVFSDIHAAKDWIRNG